MQRQIGNAVPSLLAEILAREIGTQFFGAKYKSAPKLTVELRNDCPSPIKPKKVPKKFHELAGEHEAHPGTGKGPGARREQLATSRA